MDLFKVFELKDFVAISSCLGEMLSGASVPTMRKWSKQLFEKLTDYENCFAICRYVIAHDVYEVRFFCSLLLGIMASDNVACLDFLKNEYCNDENWRVQEANAKAFNLFCEHNGYKNSVETISDWLGHSNENVRRAATEGLRVWTSKPYFCEHPQKAIDFLAGLKEDTSQYVRKSVANCYSDIGKTYPMLVLSCFSTWDINNRNSYFIVTNGCRHLKKSYTEVYTEIIEKREN